MSKKLQSVPAEVFGCLGLALAFFLIFVIAYTQNARLGARAATVLLATEVGVLAFVYWTVRLWRDEKRTRAVDCAGVAATIPFLFFVWFTFPGQQLQRAHDRVADTDDDLFDVQDDPDSEDSERFLARELAARQLELRAATIRASHRHDWFLTVLLGVSGVAVFLGRGIWFPALMSLRGNSASSHTLVKFDPSDPFSRITPQLVDLYQKHFEAILASVDVVNYTNRTMNKPFDEEVLDRDEATRRRMGADAVEHDGLDALTLDVITTLYFFADFIQREMDREEWVRRVMNRERIDYFPDPRGVYALLARGHGIDEQVE